MSKTAVVFSPIYYQHNPGKAHPESPKRLKTIINELSRGELSKNLGWQFVKPQRARIEDVALVHDLDYIRFIETICKRGGGVLDSGDTVASSRSFEVALYAVGGALNAVDLVMEKQFANAFALVRPPGHHAEKLRAYGFCIFNNVAIAAEHLLKEHALKRILILDVDSHHGNGTQEIFYRTDKVLYISLHEDPSSFPGTGFIDEIGESEGLGFNINIPLPFRTDDQIYLKAIKEVVKPVIHEYKPQFILVSAGLDSHYTDPVGSLSISTSCYRKIYEMLVDSASEICEGQLVSILEGGYSLRFVGKIAASVIATMSDILYRVEDESPICSRKVRTMGNKIVESVKKVQKAFWRLD